MSIPLHPPELDRQNRPAVLAVAADLLFGSRIRAAADAAGVAVHLARTADDAVEAARTRVPGLILIDLDARKLDAVALIRRLRDPEIGIRAPVVAFVSHVRTDAIDAARAAGADRVLARSAFVRELNALLAGI
jgi:CheY-like chemotaxis protein